MIFPRRTALEASAIVEKALAQVVDRISTCGDLRMGKATVSRIEFVVETAAMEPVIEAMAGVGYRKLRAGRGPMVFAREGFPKTVICVAHKQRSDLLGVTKPGNFEVLLFLRTGTQLFVRGVLAYIRANGFVMKPEQGLFRGDSLVAWTEEDIFISAGLECVPPAERYYFRPTKHKIVVNF